MLASLPKVKLFTGQVNVSQNDCLYVDITIHQHQRKK